MKGQNIFFSYARADAAAVVLRLAKDLRRAGATVWLDQVDIRGGENYNEAIEQALQEATCVLFVLTEKSLASKYVLAEVYYALDEEKTVIPLVFQPCKLPFRLRGLQCVDFTGDYETAYDRLLTALGVPKKDDTQLPRQEALGSNKMIAENLPLQERHRRKAYPFSLLLRIAVAVFLVAGLTWLVLGRPKREGKVQANQPVTDSAFEAFFKTGKTLLVKGSFDEAIEKFTAAIDRKADYAAAYYDRGLARDGILDYAGAVSDYTKAIGLKPDYADAYNNRGTAKYHLEDYHGAVVDYTKAVEVDTAYAAAYNNRGLAKCRLSDFKNAIADYDKALALQPGYKDAYYNRGLAKNLIGEKESACNDFQKGCNLGDSSACGTYHDLCK